MIPIAVAVMQPALAVVQRADLLTIDNGRIRVSVHRKAGVLDVTWGAQAALYGLFGEVRIDGHLLRTTDLHNHATRVKSVSDAFGRGVCLTIKHSGAGQEGLRQLIWVYAGKGEMLTRIETTGPNRIKVDYLAPIASNAPVSLNHRAPLNSLFVPWDNDAYARYRSDGWEQVSHEVGVLYDDSTRRGLVVGSLDHDVWKSGVQFRRGHGVRAFAGLVDKYTHDTQRHGAVIGNVVASPRIALGFYRDWRVGLERFGDLNAVVRPPLAWTGGVPFGWNSWAGHKDKLKAADARAATDFIGRELPVFRNDGAATITLDSFWTNLKPNELREFVVHAHALGLKAGIYWTPFACWGSLDTPTDTGSKWTFRQIVLKDTEGRPLPRLDSAYPIDPTHPGSLERIDRELRMFVDTGFDYLKLDFLSHGALEAVHYDPTVPTGNAAYAIGMRRIVEDLSPRRIGRPFFISASIAPLFPHGFAHSRRISCDVFANIGASEYLLNSTNYGWWPGGRLYRFNDPDSACVYQPLGEPPISNAESRTRFTASAISGGMMMEGDDLTNPEAVRRVKQIYSHREILDLARRAPCFRPIYGNTGDKAGDAYVWADGTSLYIAAFNYSKTAAKDFTIPVTRLGATLRRWKLHDLWTGNNIQVIGNPSFHLPAMDCALVRIAPIPG